MREGATGEWGDWKPKFRAAQPGSETSSTVCYLCDLGQVTYSLVELHLLCNIGVDSPFLGGCSEGDIRYKPHEVQSAVAGTWTALNRQDLNSSPRLLLLIVMTR